MSAFTKKLLTGAEKQAKSTATVAAKVAPGPPTGPQSGTLHAAAVPDLPISVRPFVDHRTLGLALERVGVDLGAGRSARLVHVAEEALAGRALDALTSAERQALVDTVRRELVVICPGVERAQRQLREQHRLAPNVSIGPDLRRSTVTARGGTWVFWHTPSPTSPVILKEGFVPTRPGTPVPPKRPDPKLAKIEGTPRWQAGGTLSTVPPALPARPTLATTGLSRDALDKAPGLILEEMTRAQRAAQDEARRVLGAVPLVRTKGGGRRAGTRIASLETFAPAGPYVPGRAWDEVTVVKGVTGPETGRRPDAEMDRVLRASGDVSPELGGYARMHAWGPIFGDESLAGLAYGPHEAVNLVQKNTAEAFMRWDASANGKLFVNAGTPTEVRQYVKYRLVGGQRLPFLVSVEYRFALEDGTLVAAVLEVTPDGKVATSVRRGGLDTHGTAR